MPPGVHQSSHLLSVPLFSLVLIAVQYSNLSVVYAEYSNPGVMKARTIQQKELKSPLPNDTRPTNKPRKAQHSQHAHPEHHAQRSPLHIPQGPTTSRTHIIRKRCVRLRDIHAKCIAVKGRQIPGSSNSTHARIRIIDNKRIRLREQRVLYRGGLICASIPGQRTSSVGDGLVHGEGVGLRVCGAGGEDIDSGGRGGEGGVVPGEGDLVADLVVGC